MKEKQAGSLSRTATTESSEDDKKDSLNETRNIEDEETECRRFGRFFEVLLLYFLCILPIRHVFTLRLPKHGGSITVYYASPFWRITMISLHGSDVRRKENV